MLVLIALIWLLAAGLLAGLLVACMRQQSAADAAARARTEVRSALSALAHPGRARAALGLEWWLTRIDALDAELTPALAENPGVRAALEEVAVAAASEALPLVLAAAPAGGPTLSRLDRLGRLACVAPARTSRRLLLALQAGRDRGLALRASAAIARHAPLFADASAPLACVAELERDPARLIGAGWALGAVSAADPKRAAIHSQDESPAVRRAVLAQLQPRAVRGAQDAAVRVRDVALARVADADADVRAAAFAALGRTESLPAAPLERGLADPDATVRAAAARALPAAGRDAASLLPAVTRLDSGLARAVGRLLRARAATEAADHDAEMKAAAQLQAPDHEARRTAAQMLASIARARSAARLHASTVAALLARLETESVGAVSAALVDALEASGDERAETALAALARRATPEWRLRLSEASALARRLRTAPPPTPTPDRLRAAR
jgi:hypothetical protein